MKIELFTLCLMTILSTSCKKDINSDQPYVQSIKSETGNAVVAGYAASSWSNISSWTSMQSGKGAYFAHSITAPEISNTALQNGTVVVFIKFESYDEVLKERPFSLPTIFIPNERYAASTIWSYDAQPGSLNIQYALDRQIDLLLDPKVQVRYFWVSNNFLAAKQMTAPDLKKLNYTQLTTLLGATQ